MWTLSRQGDSKSSVEPSYENIGYKMSNVYIIIVAINFKAIHSVYCYGI